MKILPRWDAQIVKVIENPISLRQAVWAVV